MPIILNVTLNEYEGMITMRGWTYSKLKIFGLVGNITPTHKHQAGTPALSAVGTLFTFYLRRSLTT